jgi:hypothetical protein
MMDARMPIKTCLKGRALTGYAIFDPMLGGAKRADRRGQC